ncbi:FAD-dependent oxidoreductase [Streptomyces sp. NPDC005908]|uniref:FAD-dependent oxidoreductase n=2 Tax=unclassified Streptomyces TaxID=2593676 RepID=UPI0033E0AAE9
MSTNIEVVVLGGGYDGVKAANRLARQAGVSVTLVDPRPHFVERIRLHQVVTGSDDAVESFGEVLGGDVRPVVDAANRIAAEERRVSLAGGDTLSYDYLVHAVGSGASVPGVPGAAEFAHAVADLDGARRLRSTLAEVPATAPMTVVGAGLTGVETAAELAEAGRFVTLVCGGVLGPSLHARSRRRVARRLAALGVTVLEGAGTRVTEVTRDGVRLDDGRDVPGAVTVWTAGFRVPDLAARSGLNARRPRTTVSAEETRAAPASFRSALETGDLRGLLDVLAPDVVFVSDGGGLRLAALRPVVGAGKVLRCMAGSLGKAGGVLTGEATTVNGNPGLVLRLDGGIDGVLTARVEDGRVTRLYYVRNPEKLTRVESETSLASR